MRTIIEALKNLKETLNQLNHLRVSLLIMLLVGFLAYTFKAEIGTWMIKEVNMPPIERTVNRDVLIYGLLEDMLEEFGGGRAYVYTFHNGQNFLSKDPVTKHKQRTSMDYEVVANGVKEIGLQMQNIPISLFALQLESILDEKVLGLSRELTNDLAAKNLMKDIGSTHAAVLAFRDVDERVILMVGIDWMRRKVDGMPEELKFPEIRFRKYVKDIGNLFMGYREEASVMNILDSTTRGGGSGDQHTPPDYLYGDEAIKADTLLTAHFIAGLKELPKSGFTLSR